MPTHHDTSEYSCVRGCVRACVCVSPEISQIFQEGSMRILRQTVIYLIAYSFIDTKGYFIIPYFKFNIWNNIKNPNNAFYISGKAD